MSQHQINAATLARLKASQSGAIIASKIKKAKALGKSYAEEYKQNPDSYDTLPGFAKKAIDMDATKSMEQNEAKLDAKMRAEARAIESTKTYKLLEAIKKFYEKETPKAYEYVNDLKADLKAHPEDREKILTHIYEVEDMGRKGLEPFIKFLDKDLD